MENFTLHHTTSGRLDGSLRQVIVGVVASGNLEVLAERIEADTEITVEISTAAEGFGDIWNAVVADFVERSAPGGVKFSINDGGARPDTVLLRLMQAARALLEPAPEKTLREPGS